MGDNYLVYKDQLDNEVIRALKDNSVGETDNLATENKSIVTALNEVVGKDIISNAIGYPIQNTDTFTIMGQKITELTRTLKNILLEKGIVVNDDMKLNELISKVSEI